ncbi:c-type cytochrome [Ponticoccus alexandrii]|uniref:C-type cytochrome n=1 Tax=Ponticoccus alexandrii TaxID=1943633 RepID=A0ABX7F694_9RHOB|nr:cytochrome c [Ponticoccus alexandrii]ETA50751.1 cytochrome C [Rhodobacteraceae bacterium PD-2]QRF66048.1 c-type cytochrome [Ponticoccus alexandrii]
MKRTFSLALLVGALAIGGYWLWNGAAPQSAGTVAAAPSQGDPIVTGIETPVSLTPAEQMGQTAFNAVCAACHGDNGAGRQGMGPPFINAIYKPGHHGDMAFLVAVQNGVQAHHWPFGNMPPQQGLTRADVANIVAYVRALQRTNGIE